MELVWQIFLQFLGAIGLFFCTNMSANVPVRHIGVLIFKLISCLLFLSCVIHFRMFSWGSRYARDGDEEEEGTPLEARYCGAAGHQEIPKKH